MITMEDAELPLHQVAASAKTTRSHLRCCAVSVKRWTSERSSPGKKKKTTTSTRTFNRKTTTTKRKTPSARNSLEITMSRVAAQYSCMALISMLWLSAALTGTHCQASHEVQTGRFARAEQRQQQKHYLNSVVGVFPAQQQQQQRMIEKRSASALLMPINELRVASGSKNEPPSRPTVDWSRQRPYFGSDMARNVSVELGKTAYLSCKVFELGDKTVSWLRPRENEILTAGRYTYIGDPRFASINDNGSHDWILEIKDVALNDSTSYECQVSTDPKMSAIINLHVKAAKARIKQGEQFYAPLGSNIEFTCEVGQKQTTTGTSSSFSSSSSSSSTSSSSQSVSLSATPSSHVSVQQTYWYFNGNLLNYARTFALDKNFSIDWDPMTQTSRFKLFNVQLSDAGNYTCKPTSSEPTNIRLHVKRYNKNGARDRAVQQHNVGTKEAQRNRQQYGLEPMESGAASGGLIVLNHWLTFVWPLSTTLMLILHH